MSKTIIIGTSNKFSAKTQQWLFSLTGVIFLANAGSHLYFGNSDWLRLILGILMLLGGLFYLFYGIFGFSKRSKFSMKVKVDDTMVELKNSLWKPATKLNWSDLTSIKFQSYEIVFEHNNMFKSFSYNTHPEISKQIKQTLRDFAERKNVQVIGG